MGSSTFTRCSSTGSSELRRRTRDPPPGNDLCAHYRPALSFGFIRRLQWLIRQRPPNAAQILRQLYHRYKAAPKPPSGQKHDVWYRMRMLVTRLWNRWQRLTLDQRRDDLNGTNNTSERVIGGWIKERYRTMRGYKRAESVRNIVTLTARMGASSGHYDMTQLFA